MLGWRLQVLRPCFSGSGWPAWWHRQLIICAPGRLADGHRVGVRRRGMRVGGGNCASRARARAAAIGSVLKYQDYGYSYIPKPDRLLMGRSTTQDPSTRTAVLAARILSTRESYAAGSPANHHSLHVRELEHWNTAAGSVIQRANTRPAAVPVSLR